MTRDQVKAVLDRVLTWPPERQEDAVRILEDMEELDASDYRLSDEQVAEVKRRMADPNPKYLTLEEFNAHFRDRLGDCAVVEPSMVHPDED
jgi:hypothetical protein